MSSEKPSLSQLNAPVTENKDPAEQARSKVRHLDSLCRSGEEPYEIETDVHITGRYIGELFAKHIAKDPPAYLIPRSSDTPSNSKKQQKKKEDAEHQYAACRMHVEIMFNYLYLFSNKRSRSITRYSEQLLEQMLIEASQEMNSTEFLQSEVIYLLFEEAFKFMEQIGIEVNAPLRIQQLRKIYRRMSACDVSQFAVN